jgi:hypothetical protein
MWLGLINKRLEELLGCTRKSLGARGGEGVDWRKVRTCSANGGMRVRARSGRNWLISAGEVGWGRWGHTYATCTRREAEGMAGYVRRSGGQWRATGGAPAGGSAPPGAAHLPRTARVCSHLPRTARVCSRRRSAVTGGHSGTSACVPDAGTTHTAGGQRGRARRRGGACLRCF